VLKLFQLFFELLLLASTESRDQVIVDAVDLLHIKQFVAMGVLVVGSTGPVLLDHVPVSLIDVLRRWHWVVRVVHLVLSLAHGLLVVVKLEIGDQVVYSVDLLTVVHDWRPLGHVSNLRRT